MANLFNSELVMSVMERKVPLKNGELSAGGQESFEKKKKMIHKKKKLFI